MDFGLVVPHADRIGNRIVAGSLPYMAPEALTGNVGDGAASSSMSTPWGSSPTSCSPGRLRSTGSSRSRSSGQAGQPSTAGQREAAHVPEGLVDLIARMIATDPDDRPTGAEEVLWELRALRRQTDTEGRAKPLTVLIVDDDPEMLEALSLSSCGRLPPKRTSKPPATGAKRCARCGDACPTCCCSTSICPTSTASMSACSCAE